MISRNAKYLMLIMAIAGCGKDHAILEPEGLPAAAPQVSMADGRTITSVTLNGSAPPAIINATPNQALAFVVRGFTTLDQVIATWLSTSVTFTPNPGGTLTARCDETDVWTQIMMPGSNLVVSFQAMAPAALGTYLVSVRAHQQDACSSVFPSAPYPSGPDQFILIVAPSATPPVLAPIGNRTAAELATLTFNATATDSDIPAQTLAFSLDNPSSGNFPTGATITSAGAFSWTPSEDQGPGVYRVKISVSDGTLSDAEEIDITVSEVNAAPELSLPAVAASQWGVRLPNVVATATDGDLPANSLTFEKVSGPSWVTVDPTGTISFGAVGASSVGSHTLRVRVTDNGSPALPDEEAITLTVQNRPSALTYTGRTSGQYSDKSLLSATLLDAGAGSLNGSPVANASISFSVDGVSGASIATSAAGSASTPYTVTQGAGSLALAVHFAGGQGYASSNAAAAFAVSQEDASLDASFPGLVAAGTSDVVVNVSVIELLQNGAEPVPNDGALPGDVSKVAAVEATLRGLNTNTEHPATCAIGSGAAGTFNCTFAAASLVGDTYTLEVILPASDPFYRAAPFEGRLSVGEQEGIHAHGAGTFMLDGDRVMFGFSTRVGPQGPRTELVVMRHLAAGGVCRLASGEKMNAPSVQGNRITLSGKGSYSCVGRSGSKTGTASADITFIAEDNGTPGSRKDRIWLTNSASVDKNMLAMPQPALTQAPLLTAGNVTVRSP